MLIHVQKGKYRYAYSVLGMEPSFFLVIQSIFFFFFQHFKKHEIKEPLFFCCFSLPRFAE